MNRNILSVMLTGIGLVALAGCTEKGPAERAGEQIDDALSGARDNLQDAAEEAEDAAQDLRDSLRDN